MTDEKIEVFRERLQPRLRDYLKAAHVELSEDEITTVCPICGDMAGLMKEVKRPWKVAIMPSVKLPSMASRTPMNSTR